MFGKSTIYVNEKVNKRAVVEFMQGCKENETNVHSFEIIQNGQVVVKIAPAPYSFEFKQQLYSVSKSFTSTAIGFLYDEKKLNIEDKIIDIFADHCPEKIGESTKKIKLKHVLSMNTGHAACILEQIKECADPVKAFLSEEPEFEPGTHFEYDNAATYLLSEIVRKYTNMSLFDYLTIKLFKPLGIENVHWNAYKSGNSQGAIGLCASCDDIAKLGMLYLGGGIYNGERILSEDWVEKATSVWSDTIESGTPDWTAGYGFQFWRNSREGFRCDGAYGQLCIVLPSSRTVFALQGASFNTSDEMFRIYDFIDKLFSNDETNMTYNELVEFVDSYNKVFKYDFIEADIFSKTFKCDENPYGISFVSLENNQNCISFCFSDGVCIQKMNFGKDCRAENKVHLKNFKPTLVALDVSNVVQSLHFSGFCTFKGEKLHLYFNHLDNPHTEELVCSFDNDKLTVKRKIDFEATYNDFICGNAI